MTSLPITQLTPTEALQQAIQASQLLLKELGSFDELKTDEETKQLNQLANLRDQLMKQVFANAWSQQQVSEHNSALQTLEALNSQLIKQASNTRSDLHQQRVDNQQGRKAVSAYGKSKGQFLR